MQVPVQRVPVQFYFNFLNTLLFLGYSVSQWVSLYRPCQEDRIHNFKCRFLEEVGQVQCGSEKSLNAPKQAFSSFTCPKNGFITAVSSHFDKASKDRRYCVCFSNIRPALISASCNCPSFLQHFSLPSDQLPHLVCLVPSHSFIGAEENKRGRLVFCFPAPPACTFSSSHQPLQTLLACSHALQFIFIHYSQEKPLPEAAAWPFLLLGMLNHWGKQTNTGGKL